MKKFEYKIVNFSGTKDDIEVFLNHLGSNGWELMNTKLDGTTNIFIFKRESGAE